MKSELYAEIIKKQQELINLMINAGIAGVDNINIQMQEKQTVTPPEEASKIECDLEGFVKWLKLKGMSQNSIDSYAYAVNEFFAKHKALNKESLAEYEQFLKGTKRPRTVNLRMAGMCKYFKYINYTEYEFTRVKERKKTFCNDAITEPQYNKLIEWAELNQPTVWLIAKVCGGTGVRVSELIELRTEDLYKGYADIVGKGNKQRRIYFTDKLVDEIKDKCGKIFIVENRYGNQMTTRGVSALLVSASEKTGIPKEVMHPHSFRHFFAKQFMKSTQDISLLGDLLGHSDISTTAIYTRLTADEQKEEMNKLIRW